MPAQVFQVSYPGKQTHPFTLLLIVLGHFQISNLRIEIEASEASIQAALLRPACWQQWLWPQCISPGLPEQLESGIKFSSFLGPFTIQHQVEIAEQNCLQLILSQGIDGFHEWYWGEGWVQSRLEGVSLLPLNCAQTLNLIRLRHYLLANVKLQ